MSKRAASPAPPQSPLGAFDAAFDYMSPNSSTSRVSTAQATPKRRRTSRSGASVGSNQHSRQSSATSATLAALLFAEATNPGRNGLSLSQPFSPSGSLPPIQEVAFADEQQPQPADENEPPPAQEPKHPVYDCFDYGMHILPASLDPRGTIEGEVVSACFQNPKQPPTVDDVLERIKQAPLQSLFFTLGKSNLTSNYTHLEQTASSKTGEVNRLMAQREHSQKEVARLQVLTDKKLDELHQASQRYEDCKSQLEDWKTNDNVNAEKLARCAGLAASSDVLFRTAARIHNGTKLYGGSDITMAQIGQSLGIKSAAECGRLSGAQCTMVLHALEVGGATSNVDFCNRYARKFGYGHQAKIHTSNVGKSALQQRVADCFGYGTIPPPINLHQPNLAQAPPVDLQQPNQAQVPQEAPVPEHVAVPSTVYASLLHAAFAYLNNNGGAVGDGDSETSPTSHEDDSDGEVENGSDDQPPTGENSGGGS